MIEHYCDTCPCRVCSTARGEYDRRYAAFTIPARPRRHGRWLTALPWFLVLAVGSGAMWLMLLPFLESLR